MSNCDDGTEKLTPLEETQTEASEALESPVCPPEAAPSPSEGAAQAPTELASAEALLAEVLRAEALYDALYAEALNEEPSAEKAPPAEETLLSEEDLLLEEEPPTEDNMSPEEDTLTEGMEPQEAQALREAGNAASFSAKETSEGTMSEEDSEAFFELLPNEEDEALSAEALPEKPLTEKSSVASDDAWAEEAELEEMRVLRELADEEAAEVVVLDDTEIEDDAEEGGQEVDADELAMDVAMRMATINQDLSLVADVFLDLEPEQRAMLLKQLYYACDMVAYLERLK
ncbi:MAG: hypothetical protein FWD46_08425 [Cystobacterineae bacterium]|nr:hypothetical protein [Cystobacterineae bacterium]